MIHGNLFALVLLKAVATNFDINLDYLPLFISFFLLNEGPWRTTAILNPLVCKGPILARDHCNENISFLYKQMGGSMAFCISIIILLLLCHNQISPINLQVTDWMQKSGNKILIRLNRPLSTFMIFLFPPNLITYAILVNQRIDLSVSLRRYIYCWTSLCIPSLSNTLKVMGTLFC
jgi:hypothetical protein